MLNKGNGIVSFEELKHNKNGSLKSKIHFWQLWFLPSPKKLRLREHSIPWWCIHPILPILISKIFNWLKKKQNWYHLKQIHTLYFSYKIGKNYLWYLWKYFVFLHKTFPWNHSSSGRKPSSTCCSVGSQRGEGSMFPSEASEARGQRDSRSTSFHLQRQRKLILEELKLEKKIVIPMKDHE